MLEAIQEYMIAITTATWVFAAFTAYKFKNMFGGASGWTYVMIGSILFLARLLLKYYPGYSDKTMALRFMIGALAGAFLIAAFYKLYRDAKALTSF